MKDAIRNTAKPRPTTEMIKAVGYMRTSSASNTGTDKDSDKRQRIAIEAYAHSAGIRIVDWFYDEAVSGADPIDTRDGFAAMLDRIATNGVRTIIVETANRFARDLMVQETGYRMLQELDVTLVAADSPHAFVEDGPTATMVRQILGAVAQFEKAMVVAKLKGARDRKRATGVKVEGRKSVAETNPEAQKLAKRLAHGNRNERLSLRQIANKLAEAGHVTGTGKPFSPNMVKRLLGQSTEPKTRRSS